MKISNSLNQILNSIQWIHSEHIVIHTILHPINFILYLFSLSIVSRYVLRCLNNLKIITENGVVNELFYSTGKTFLSLRHYNNSCNHNIYSIFFNLYLFTYQLFGVISFTVWYIFGSIKVNRVVSDFFSFNWNNCFDQYIIIIKVVRIIFFSRCIIYILQFFIVWSHKLRCSKYWRMVKGIRVVSVLFFIWTEECFWSEHPHNKSRTHNILLTLFHLYFFNIYIDQIHKLHCSNHFKTINVNIVVIFISSILLFQYFRSVHHQHMNKTHKILLISYLYLYIYWVDIIQSQANAYFKSKISNKDNRQAYKGQF